MSNSQHRAPQQKSSLVGSNTSTGDPALRVGGMEEVDEEGLDMLTFMAQMKEAHRQSEHNQAHGNPVT